MTVPIDRGSANQSMPQRRDAGPSDSAKDHTARSDFAALMESERANLDGMAMNCGNASSPRIFDAEGFFGRLHSQMASSPTPNVPSAVECSAAEHVTTANLALPETSFERSWASDAAGRPAGAGQISVSSIGQSTANRTGRPLFKPMEFKEPSRNSGLRQRTADQYVDRAEEVKPVPRSGPTRDAASAIRVTVSAGFVHISGRIELLSNDEEKQLVEQIAQLLAEHGLAPSNIRVNGHLLVPIVQKG